MPRPYIPQENTPRPYTSASDVIIANQNNQPDSQSKIKDAFSGVLDTAKAAVGGIASGVGGAALTAEDYLARKGVEKFGTDQMKQNMVNAPKLNDQFKTAMGGDRHPTAFGVGQLGGEVATLAAPVGALGKVAKVGAEALGAGAKTAKLAQAATEGAAFTAGQGLTENKNQSLEDYAINTGLNVAFPGVGMVAKSVGESVPGRIINSLIKPLAKDFAYGKNPGETISKLGITGNTMEELIQNIKTARQDAGSTIGSVISQAQSPLKLDLNQTLKGIDEAINVANRTPRTNATLLSRLDNVKADIVDNLNTTGDGIEAAQGLKGLIGDLTKWTGAHSDDAAVNKALQKTYTSIRDQMDSTLKSELSPEEFAKYKEASDNYGNLMSAENAATHRDAILNRQDLISFGAKNAGFLAGLGSIIATGGASIPAWLAAGAGVAIDKAAATPAFKTRLAKLLSKLAPEEVGTIFDKIPTAKALFNEQEIKQFGSEIKKNTSNQINRGMINFDEIISSIIPTKKLINEAKDAVEKLESTLSYVDDVQSPNAIRDFRKELQSLMNAMGRETVITDSNYKTVLQEADDMKNQLKAHIKKSESQSASSIMNRNFNKK